MEKVVLLTGASSGIGMETAKLFQSKNWKVAATMRTPESCESLCRIADIDCFRLDVTDSDAIVETVSAVLAKFGRIDVLINNAGYGLLGPFEAASDEQIERQFQTNVFGLMMMTRAVLPYFREQRRGHIINIASVGGRVTFPFSSLYNSTKWAVEGFSESLKYELDPFNVKVKLIEPGPIKTDFYSRSKDIAKRSELMAYDDAWARFDRNMAAAGESAPDGQTVAEAIYLAATDGSDRLRYGVNTKGLLAMRRILPEGLFFRLVKAVMLK